MGPRPPEIFVSTSQLSLPDHKPPAHATHPHKPPQGRLNRWSWQEREEAVRAVERATENWRRLQQQEQQQSK